MSRETKIKIDIETSQTESSLKALREELKRVKDEMAGLEEGSDAFLQAAKKGGELQHQIQEINQSIRGASADFGDMLGNITHVGAGITGAFQAAKGAMELMGVESENVTKAIKDMQSIMAMTQGLDSIDQAIKSFKKLSTIIGISSKSLSTFKKALIGTGLGALVVVLGSIISNWDEFTKSIGLSTKQLEKLGEVASGVFNVLKGSLQGITKAITKVVTGDFKGALESLKNGFNFKQLYAEGVEAKITQREKEELAKREEAHKKYLEEREKELDLLVSKTNATISNDTKRTKELIKIEQERLKLYKQGTKEYYDQLIKINELKNKLNKTSSTGSATSITDNKELEQLEKDLDNLRKSQRTKLQIIEENAQEERDILNKSREQNLIDEETYQKMLLEIDKKYAQERNDYALSLLGNIKGGDVNSTDSFNEQLNSLSEQKQAELDLTKYYYEQGLLAKEDYESRTLEIEKTYAAQSQQIQQQRVDSIINIAAAASNLLTGMLVDISEQQDQSNKEGFEKAKKLQIAAATIQMLTGIATAMAGAFTTKSGPWDIALAAIQAASIASAGAFQIAKIKNTKFDSASTGASSASISGGALNTFVAPVQYTQDVQGGSIQEAIGNTKVYVTESDISKTQNKVSVVEQENRY